MFAFSNLAAQYKNDLNESQKLEFNSNDLKSLCIFLGPYRNLTTLTSALLFLHPNCQVLNHAALRILPFGDINFLNDYSEKKLTSFIKYAIYISKNGRMGDLGGSILYSHAFQNKTLIETYNKRFGNSKIKDEIHSFIWKDSMRITNYIREKKININTLLSKNKKIKFIMPIRNPLDVAISNFERPHKRLLSRTNLYSLEKVVSSILKEISWFLDLAKLHPSNFYYYHQNDLNEDSLEKIAKFLEIKPETNWISDAKKCLSLKESYDYSEELISYFNIQAKKIINNKNILEKILISFCSKTKFCDKN